MSRTQDRDQLVAQLARALPTLSTSQVIELARKLARAGATLQRLAEAQCNGDYPYNGPWCLSDKALGACEHCNLYWALSSFKRGRFGAGIYGKLCPECRMQGRMMELLLGYGLVPYFQSDPRGPVFHVFRPEVSEQDKESGRERGIYVA